MFTDSFMEVTVMVFKKNPHTGEEIEELSTGYIDPLKITTFYALPDHPSYGGKTEVDISGANSISVYMSLEDFKERVNEFVEKLKSRIDGK